MQEKDIKNKIEKLQKFIRKFLLDNTKKNQKISIWHKDIENKILPFVTSGKNMRGLLVLLASGKEDSDSFKLASAIELIHSSFLIHDDIMDQDEVRRGENSIYIKYAKEFKNNNIHYGISQAISLGDICFFLAFELLNQIKHPNKEKIISFLTNEVVRVGFGQMQDVFYSFSDKEPDFDTIIEICKSKTARYSISLPIGAGSLLSDNEFKQKVFNQILIAGENLGIAFQLKDDYLGVWGSQSKTGKGVLKDINKNKKTLIRMLLLKNTNNKEKKDLNQIFGNDNISKTQESFLFEVLAKYKILETHDFYISNYNKKAKSYINKLPLNLKEIFLFIEKFNNERVK